MRLSEDHASRLVAEWTKDCEWIAPAPPTLTGASPFTHPRLVVGSKRHELENMSNAKAYGLSLRRAMEGLNALAVCFDFDPEENPQFWQRTLEQLARTSELPPLQRLTSRLLSRYDVCCSFCDDTATSAVAYGLATCLSMEPTSPAMEVRRQVLEQLRDYLCTTPPPLDFVFGGRYRRSSQDDWRSFQQTMGDLVHARRLAAVSRDLHTLKAVLGRERLAPFPAGNWSHVCSCLADAIKMETVDVSEIHGSDQTKPYFVWGASGLGDLLSSATTAKSISWQFDSASLVNISILCSAVAYMRQLESLVLTKNYVGNAVIRSYEWLAFVLKRRQLQGLQLALCAWFDSEGATAFVRAIHHEETFGCLIPEIVRETAELEYFPLGTSAKPACGTELTQELLVDQRDQTKGRRSCGRRLDVLARCEQRCIVVVPGFGLMWIQTKALTSWEHPADHVPASLPRALSRLAVSNTLLRDAILVIRAVEADSKCIDVSDRLHTDFSPEDFAALQSSQSSLHSLLIPGGAITRLDELPTGRGKVEVLAISSIHSPVTVSSPSPFFSALSESTTPIRHVLRELSVKAPALSLECVRDLAASLSTNRRLRFLQFRASAGEDALSPLMDQLAIPLGPTDRSKVWLYAFLLSVRQSPRWGLLPCVCKRLVVEFGAVQARRQVVLL